MGSVLFFTLGSLLCAMAPNITMLIAFRVIQGLGGGVLMPLTFTILTLEAGPQRPGRLMAVLGIPMLLGPICGPILGGWLIDSFSWEWIFRINLPIGVLAFVLAAIVFPKDEAHPSETLDFLGMLMLSPGLATFLCGVSSIPSRGTAADPHVYIPASIGLVLMIGFVFHALYRADHPLIDPWLFKNRVLTLANTTMIGTALMSVILTNQFNHSQYIGAATKMAALRQEAAKRGVPPDPTQFPPQALVPDFMQLVTHDLSRAYTVVFVVAVCLVLSTLVPASFLPKKPAAILAGPVFAH